MSPSICVDASGLNNAFQFNRRYFQEENSNNFIQFDETDGILGEIEAIDLPYDPVFVERTNAAFDRVSEDEGAWLSADDFLKELETW